MATTNMKTFLNGGVVAALEREMAKPTPDPSPIDPTPKPAFDPNKRYKLMLVPNASLTAYETKWVEDSTAITPSESDDVNVIIDGMFDETVNDAIDGMFGN